MKNEKEMYPILKSKYESSKLKYKVLPARKKRGEGVTEVALNTDKKIFGQDSVELDILAYKNRTLLNVECKLSFTVAMFVAALGQIILHHWMFEKFKDDLFEQLNETFKDEVSFNFGNTDKIEFAIALSVSDKRNYPFGEEILESLNHCLRKPTLIFPQNL